MRLNKFLAQYTQLSRRSADEAIEAGRVTVNGQKITKGLPVESSDEVTLDSRPITPDVNIQTIMLNKPVDYVCSRDGQGSKTVYNLLPHAYHNLNPVGRLDKDSSGLLLMTNDGELAQQLTHPSYQKNKVYEVELDRVLQPLHQQIISDNGVLLDDGPSKLNLHKLDGTRLNWQVTMHEGRNRQVRRTFESLGYEVVKLHRTQFGSYSLDSLASGLFENSDK